MVKYFFAFFLLLLPCDGNAATIYMGAGETYTSLQAAFAAMASGDTLIIRDGTYTGASNTLDTTHYPPHGSDGSYTIIQAENPGNVILDGEGSRIPVWYEPGTAQSCYWVFNGIEFKNSSAQNAYIVRGSYIKFLNCGFAESAGDYDSFMSHTCSYLLLEDCYSYGNARYHFHYYATTNSIFRRCVARHDRGSWTYQVGFQVYASRYIAVQNCIFLDGDQDAYYNSVSQYFAFKIPQVSSGDIVITGSLAVASPSASFLFVQIGENNTVFDCAVSGLASGDYFRGTSIDIDHVTYSYLSGNGTYGDGTTKTINNSLMLDITGTAILETGGTTTSDYNALYANGADYSGVPDGANDLCAANSNAIDPIDGTPGNGIPAILYLTRIEVGSDLDGAASDSGDIGATILKKIGVAETLYGESGYNAVTMDNLWPFPNEDLIKNKFQAYTWDDGGGGDLEITGNRGFASSTAKQLNGVSDTTLTSYIWEYLGNQIPETIYGAVHRGGGKFSGGVSFH